MLKALKFPPKVINWNYARISSPSPKVINGICGLRHGCLMAPYIFIVVMKYLGDLFIKENDKRNMMLHKKL